MLPALVKAQSTIRVFTSVKFFDGYAGRVSNPPPLPGVLRHRNDLYARKLEQSELDQVGNSLRINVIIRALCDNYDRIGNVNLALVPKGDTAYHPDSVQRLELARFITPFMNKNIWPDTVPYSFQADNVAHILRDSALRARYDFWAELQVFGVPYAAQTQIAGCAGRIDVFYGFLDFVTSPPAPVLNNNVLIPLQFQHYLNNYNAAATDTVDKTSRTIPINVPEDLTDATLFLITSNHGANNNGEEYNRRWHYVYFDDTLRLTYKPGRTSCEPFRRYNTQGNGIYGGSAMSDAQWQSFSNWCPGDVITTRTIPLGAVRAGSHKFLIRVPEAVFANREGYFPVSLYLQGKTSGSMPVGTSRLIRTQFKLYPNPASSSLTVEGDSPIGQIVFFNSIGQKVLNVSGDGKTEATVALTSLAPGLYTVRIYTRQGVDVQKVQVTASD